MRVSTALLASALCLAGFARAGAAPSDAASSGMAQMKQVVLTQKQIDGVIAAQKPIEAIEAKQPQTEPDKLDPKVEAQLASVVKNNGFADLGEYSDVTSSIGIVMAGMDPQTKAYVGPEAIIRKQMAEIQADKRMPPKEKTEALSELKEAMGSAATAKPTEGNIEIVAKNFDALTRTMQPDAN